jgi:hypothetical protein
MHINLHVYEYVAYILGVGLHGFLRSIQSPQAFLAVA